MTPSCVAVTPCRGYAPPEVRRAAENALTHLGGIGAFVRRGDRVLLKPNLLSARRPGDGVTTHPALVRAMIEIVEDAGGLPFVGDSPCGIRGGIDGLWGKTGMKEACAGTGAKLVSFEKSGSVSREAAGAAVSIAGAVADSDVVISLPKLKTHALTVMTCAVKNTFGFIPGYRKRDLHLRFPACDEMARLVLDVSLLRPPELTVVDAIVAMEGNGPASGKLRETDLIVAGASPHAVDAVCADIMGIDPSLVTTLVLARERGLAPRALDVRGTSPAAAAGRPFSLPPTQILRWIPSGLVKALRPLFWTRPAMGARCTGCGACVEACPAGALSLSGPRPVLNARACIECYCCMESCPEGAVRIRRSLLCRLLP